MNRKLAESNRTFYDRISRAYDLIADAGEHRARQIGEEALGVQPAERVLEVGFGTGNSLIQLAHFVGAEGHVVGIDVSPGMKRVAERKINDQGLADRIQLDVGDARRLAYDDASFDAAFMSFTLELFRPDEIPLVLDQIHRVLRPGGRLSVVSIATVPPGENPSLLERTYVWMHEHFPHIVGNRSRPLVVNGDFTLNRTLNLNPLVAVALPRPFHVGASNVAAWGVGPNQSDQHRDNLKEKPHTLIRHGFLGYLFCDKYIEASCALKCRSTSGVEEAATVC